MASFTLAQVVALVREELLAFATDFTFIDGWTDDTLITSPPAYISLTSKINQALADINLETGFNQSATTVTLASGTREYALAEGVYSLRSVSIGNNRLRCTNLESLDHQGYNWRSLSGTPNRYYTTSLNTIGFIPNPNAVLTVNIAALSNTTTLAASTDTLPATLPLPFQYLVSTRAALLIAEIDTGNDNAKDRAKHLAVRYAAGLTRLKAEVAARMQDEDSPLHIARVANSGNSNTPDPGEANGG
jgi:hypothetical protein